MAKQLLPFTPSFSPSTQQISFAQWPNFAVDKLYAVINVTRNQPLYIAGAPGLGLTAISADGKTITLSYNTTSYATGDLLNVYYDTQPGYENNYAEEIGGQLQQTAEYTNQMLAEMRLISRLLGQIGGINDNDIDQMRIDLLENPLDFPSIA